MKLSCLPVSYFTEIRSGAMSVGQWASLGAELGLDGIDLSILFFENGSEPYLKTVRDEISSSGMQIAVVNTYSDLTHPDPAERKRQGEELDIHIRSAGLLDAKMVRVTAGQAHPGLRRKDGIAWTRRGLRKALETAEQVGVKLVYENHSKPGVWHYPDFSWPSDIFLEIAQGFEDTGLGILFDTANPVARGEDPLPLLEKVIERVCCVHAADTGSIGILKPVLLGTGVVPLSEICARLKEFGYSGWISIEEASGLGRRGVERAVALVRQLWDSPASE
jgi:sugar phosphate isomerase/epimerase